MLGLQTVSPDFELTRPEFRRRFATGAAVGRGANMALNSNALRRAVLGQPQPNAFQLLADPRLTQFAYRSAPVLAADQ